MMNTTLSTPGTERCPTQTSLEPPPDTPGAVTEPSPPPREVSGFPADMYEDMPPLEGQEYSDEGGKGEVETQGAICIVAPVPKGRGRR